jgi:uncharacterized protein YegL
MKLEISLHASQLKNVAGAFKGTSDPFAVVTQIATTPGTAPKVLGKTEVYVRTLNHVFLLEIFSSFEYLCLRYCSIQNSTSPNWVSVIEIDYEFGTPFKIAVQIFDEEKRGAHKSMGSATFDIDEVLGARGNMKAKKFEKGGTIFCHIIEKKGSGTLTLGLSGNNLKNTEGFMKKSDPFFELLCKRDGAGGLVWDNVHRSEVVMNNLNPSWKDAIVPLSILNQGDMEKPIQINVYDFESNGRHVKMGTVETSVKALQSLVGKTLPLKIKATNTGTLTVKKCDITGIEELTGRMEAASISNSVPVPSAPISSTPNYITPNYVTPTVPSSYSFAANRGATFMDYITGGCELNVNVAIDFTGSNGDPRRPGTLHYLDPYGLNDYQKAITAIVGILSKYDSDQMYPVWGFGAKYGGVVRHCFQCGPYPEARGVQGILDAYKETFRSGLVMSGPTVFIDVLRKAAATATANQQAARAKGKQAYTILLILTDGAVSDPTATAQVLRECSSAPLSVIIVGIGNADFGAMQFLDNANSGEADIAQFVAFNQHCRNSIELTSETLQEIPAQLTRYFQRNGIPPLPPVVRRDSEVFVESEDQEIDLTLDFGGPGSNDIYVTSGGQDFVTGFGHHGQR